MELKEARIQLSRRWVGTGHYHVVRVVGEKNHDGKNSVSLRDSETPTG